MTNLLQLMQPAGRDHMELVRAGREGTYWQSPDGLVVRVASAQAADAPDAGTEAVHRALLELACREAAERQED